jgi:hypothetical protein
VFNHSLAPLGCPPLLAIATSLHVPLFVLPFVETSWRVCECWASLRVPLLAKLTFCTWHWLGSLCVHHVSSPICSVVEYYASLNVWPLRITITHMKWFFVVVHGCWHKNISGAPCFVTFFDAMCILCLQHWACSLDMQKCGPDLLCLGQLYACLWPSY